MYWETKLLRNKYSGGRIRLHQVRNQCVYKRKPSKLLPAMIALSCVFLHLPQAHSNSIDLRLPMIVNPATLNQIQEELRRDSAINFISGGSIWIDGTKLNIENHELKGEGIQIQIGGKTFRSSHLNFNAQSTSSGGGFLEIGSLTGHGNGSIALVSSGKRGAVFLVNGDLTATGAAMNISLENLGTDSSAKLVVSKRVLLGSGSRVTLQGRSLMTITESFTANIGSGILSLSEGGESDSLVVGGDFIFSNANSLNTEVNPDLRLDASINKSSAKIGGNFVLNGVSNSPSSYLQISETEGSGFRASAIYVNAAKNNSTSLVLGHGARIASSSGFINLTAEEEGSQANLFIGDSSGRPSAIDAALINMNSVQNQGDVCVVLSNNAGSLKDGFDFSSKITGWGQVENRKGINSLTNAQNDYSGTTVVSSGLLRLTSPKTVGSSRITVNSSPEDESQGLVLDYHEEETPLSNELSGSGVIIVSDYAVVKSEKAENFFGKWNVLGTLKLGEGAVDSAQSLGNGTSQIGSNGKIIISDNSKEAKFIFRTRLIGDGTLDVYFAGNGNSSDLYTPTFEIETGKGADFEGTINLEGASAGNKVKYVLNSNELKNASFKVGENSILSIGHEDDSVEQFSIKSLEVAGGTLNFEKVEPGLQLTDKSLAVTGELNVDRTGAVRIDLSKENRNFDNEQAAQALEKLSLMEQDDGSASARSTPSIKLIDAKDAKIIGTAAGFSILDEEGKTIVQQASTKIHQNGKAVAEAIYDWRLSTVQYSDNGTEVPDGLYLTYGLTEVKLIEKDASALTLHARDQRDADPLATDLSAKLSGEGDLIVSAPSKVISLSNPTNDFTGKTYVKGLSTLRIEADSALGKSSSVNLERGSLLDLNNHVQEIGSLYAAEDARVNLGETSDLTILNGGQIRSDNTLNGHGFLRVAGGSLRINGINSDLHSVSQIQSDAEVVLNSSASLGDGTIQNDGRLVMKNLSDGPLKNEIQGKGSLKLTNSQTSLGGDNRLFTGDIEIGKNSALSVSEARNLGRARISNGGVLTVNSSSNWELSNPINGLGSLVKKGAGELSIGSDNINVRRTEVREGELVLGSAARPITFKSSFVQIAPKASLSGFGTIKGNLINEGTLNIGSEKGQPSTLHIDGDFQGNGGTIVFKTYLAGDNSPTDKLVISGSSSGVAKVAVNNIGGNGDRTRKGIQLIHVDGSSEAEFIQEGRISAGGFDYYLERGTGANSNNWYLRTKDIFVRPEVGSYIANEETIQTAFVTRQLDRGGKTEYADFLSGEKKSTGLWLRQNGGYNSWKDSSGNTKTRSNRYTAQIGGDIGVWADAENRKALHLGVMAGYVHSRAITHSVVNSVRSIGKTKGYGLGMYATWFADEINREGAYLDAWFNYGWFKSTVSGNDNPKETSRSKGLTGSLEAGYTRKLNSNEYGDWYVQPQAQVLWMGVNTPDRVEKNGTRVKLKGHGAVQTRLGTRFYVQSNASGAVKDAGPFRLYAEANWIHNTRRFGVTMDGDVFTQAGASNLAEMKLGGEKKIGQSLHLWGGVGSRFGSHDYKDLSATVGAKFIF